MITTDHLLQVGHDTLTLTSDGLRGVIEQFDDAGCCTDVLCSEELEHICGGLDNLPTGPMWDIQKAQVREALLANGGAPDGTVDLFPCPSMAVYAAYIGQVTHDVVFNIIAPHVRESSPHTAVTTVDEWLDRFRWVDCFQSNCAPPYTRMFSPYLVKDDNGNTTCESCTTDFGDEFEAALKHNLLRALHRLSKGVIHNVQNINWIIEPLGAALGEPDVYPDEVQDAIDNPCPEDCGEGNACPACWCDLTELSLSSSADDLKAAPTEEAFCDRTLQLDATVPALQSFLCPEDPNAVTIDIYPGVVVAECIVRSLLKRSCPNIITRMDP